MGLLLFSTTTLLGGLRVRLRLPHGSDREQLRDLAVRLGAPLDELTLRRALAFDPRERLVVCATAWLGSSHVLLGAGVVDRGALPELLLADEHSAPGIGRLLESALVDWAAAPRAGAA